ncbi:hypothetical protein [Thiovibrio frasassiensis]|uniref:Uncharacterized protein n=1 Tax=Thiovibrio frasassiensis TaxID=2984131 RepID=A0A9X4MBY2_9BACT|nr:hypothetical protein [Thiovibrio frasassiensis]MDG4474661.1 hypothetical protein [Thiovibrio frasassiensis]
MSLSSKFIDLLRDKNCRDLLINNSEVILDQICEDELIKSIPIISNLTNTGKAVLAFRDRYLIRKIGIFLNQINSVDQESLSKFLEKLDKEGYRKKVGEKLLILLDKADDDEKAKVTGELFKRYVSEEISKDTFELLCEAVNKTFFFNLHHLRHGHVNPNIMVDIGPFFLPYRMVKIDLEYIKHNPDALFGEHVKPDHISQSYTLTFWGKELVRILNEIYG